MSSESRTKLGLFDVVGALAVLIIAIAVAFGLSPLKPTGPTANNRVAGYMEVLKTIHESAMSEECKRETEFVIMNSTPIGQYFVEPAAAE